MLDCCKELFDKWNLHVRYCHWKSNEHLADGLDGKTDLDVFVIPDDKEVAESDLRASRYIQLVPQKGCRYPNVDEWIGFDANTGSLVHIHLHYQIITGTKFVKEYIFPIDELIIETRIKDSSYDVYVSSPNLEVVLLYSRIALKSQKKHRIHVDKDSQREIDYLKHLIDLGEVKRLCDELMDDQGEEFFTLLSRDCLDERKWYTLYKIADKWLTPYRRQSKVKAILTHYYYYIRFHR